MDETTRGPERRLYTIVEMSTNHEIRDDCPRCGAPLATNEAMGYQTCSRSGPGHYSQPLQGWRR